jgi:hypothetical protein
MSTITQQPGLVRERPEENAVDPLDAALDRALAEADGPDPLDAALDRALAAQERAFINDPHRQIFGSRPNRQIPDDPNHAGPLHDFGTSTTASQQQFNTLSNNVNDGYPIREYFAPVAETIGGPAPWVLDQVADIGTGLMNVPGDLYRQAGGVAEAFNQLPGVSHAIRAFGGDPYAKTPTALLDKYGPNSPKGMVGEVARSAGSMVVPLGVARAAKAAGITSRNLLRTIFGTTAGAQVVGSEYPQITRRMEAMDATPEQAASIARASVAPQALFGALTSMGVSRLLPGMSPERLTSVLTKAGRDPRIASAVGAVVAGSGEGLQEGGQELLSMVMRYVAEDDPAAFVEWQKRVYMSIVAGTVVGSGSHAVSQWMESRQPKPITEADYTAQREAIGTFNPRTAQEQAAPGTYGRQAPPQAQPQAAGVSVGDRVQWTSQGAAQFSEPRRVVAMSPDGEWAFVEGSTTGIPTSQLTRDGAQPIPRGEQPGPAADGGRGDVAQPQDVPPVADRVPPVVGGEGAQAGDQPGDVDVTSLTLPELKALDLSRGGTGKGTKAAILKRLSTPDTARPETSTATSGGDSIPETQQGTPPVQSPPLERQSKPTPSSSGQTSDFSSMPLPALRAEAVRLGIDPKGTAAALRKRLTAAVPTETPQPTSRLGGHEDTSTPSETQTERHLLTAQSNQGTPSPSQPPAESVAKAKATIAVGDRITLPEWSGASGVGKNYGIIKDAVVVGVSPKFVTVESKNTPENEALFGPVSRVRLPRVLVERAGEEGVVRVQETKAPKLEVPAGVRQTEEFKRVVTFIDKGVDDQAVIGAITRKENGFTAAQSDFLLKRLSDRNKAPVVPDVGRAPGAARVGVDGVAGVGEAKGTPVPKDLPALRAKYPGVTFKPVRGVYIPSTLKGRALAEWRNTASGVPFKDQIPLLDARLAKIATAAKSRADKIVDKANALADEAQKRRQERTITRKNKPGERSGGSPLIPDAIDFGIELAARAVANGITGGQALSAHIKDGLKNLPKELNQYKGRVRYVARRVIEGATVNGKIDASLLEDAVQTERLRHESGTERRSNAAKIRDSMTPEPRDKTQTPPGPNLRKQIDADLGVKKAPTYLETGDINPREMMPDYAKAIEEAHRAIRNRKAVTGLDKLADFLKVQRERGLSNLLDDEALGRLRAQNGYGLESMKLEDQKLVERAIRHVAHLNATHRTAMVLGKLRDIEADAEKGAADLMARRAEPTQPVTDRALGRPKRGPDPNIIGKAFGRSLRDLRTMVSSAFGDKSIVHEYTVSAIARADSAAKKRKIEYTTRLSKVLEKHGIPLRDVGAAMKKAQTFDLPSSNEPVELTSAEALDITMQWSDLETRPQLEKSGYLLDRFAGQEVKKQPIYEEDVAAIEAKLPQWMKDYRDEALRVYHLDIAPAMNKTSVELTGEELATNPTYVPRARDPHIRTKGLREDSMQRRAFAENYSFTKERQGSGTPLVIGDAFLRINEYVNDASVYIETAIPIRNARLLISRNAMFNAIAERLGVSWRNTVADRLAHVGGVVNEPTSVVGPIANLLRRNTAVAVLSYNLSAAMQQTAGIPILAAEMSVAEAKALAKELADVTFLRAPEDVALLMERSGYFGDRWSKSGGEASRLYLGLDNPNQIPTGRPGELWMGAVDIGFRPMQYGDERVGVLAYRAARAALEAQGVKGDELTTRAIERAEDLVRATQNASSTLDRSGAELESRTHAWTADVMQFMSAAVKAGNVVQRRVIEARRNPTKTTIAAAGGAVAALLLSALMQEAVREFWRQAKKGFQPDQYARDNIDHGANVLGSLMDSFGPGSGQGIKSAVQWVRGKPTFDSEDTAGQLTKAIIEVGRIVNAGDFDQDKAIRSVDRGLRAAMTLGGVPGFQLADLVKGGFRAATPPATPFVIDAYSRSGDIETAKGLIARAKKKEPKSDMRERMERWGPRLPGTDKPFLHLSITDQLRAKRDLTDDQRETLNQEMRDWNKRMVDLGLAKKRKKITSLVD